MYRADVSPVSQNVSAKIMQIEDNTKEKHLKLSFFFVLCGPVVLDMICVGTFMLEPFSVSFNILNYSTFLKTTNSKRYKYTTEVDNSAATE